MKVLASGWAHRRLSWDRCALGRPGRDWEILSPVGRVLLTRAAAGLHLFKAKWSYISLCHPKKEVQTPCPLPPWKSRRRYCLLLSKWLALMIFSE